MDSILDSVKKNLGLDSSYLAFDPDILMYVNSTFSILNQLGVGPEDGFAIEDKDAAWDTFIDSGPNLHLVKTYVYLKVRMLFDPPQTSYLIEALSKQAAEIESRISTNREGVSWVSPIPLQPTDVCW